MSEQQDYQEQLKVIQLELEKLKLQNRQSKADRKLLFAVSIVIALSILSIKFELNFQDGKTSGKIQSSEFGETVNRSLELLAALGVIGAGGYAVHAAIKSAKLRNSEPPVNSEET